MCLLSISSGLALRQLRRHMLVPRLPGSKDFILHFSTEKGAGDHVRRRMPVRHLLGSEVLFIIFLIVIFLMNYISFQYFILITKKKNTT